MWRRAGAALWVALLVITAVVALMPARAQQVPAGSNGFTAEELRFAQLINEERAKRGLPQLKYSLELTEIGRAHSREMCELNYFSHYSPTARLRTPMDRYKVAKAGERMPAYLCVGENLYYSSAPDVERGHAMLMASPKHKENILREEYQYVGVGVYTSPDGRLWATEMFLAQHS